MAEKYPFDLQYPPPKYDDYYDDDSYDGSSDDGSSDDDSSDEDESSDDDDIYEDDESSDDDDIYEDDDDFSDERTIPKTNPILAYYGIVREVRKAVVDIAIICVSLWCIWNFFGTGNFDLLVSN